MNWAEYTAASRRLAEVRRREDERSAHVRDRATAGRGAVGQLRQRLTAQRDHLSALAVRLGLPAPSLHGLVRAGLTDVDDAVRRGWDAIERADADARRAEERGHQPALLPGLSSTGRNALVYAAATVLASVVSVLLWVTSPATDFNRVPLSLTPWALCGLPALAFFAGYLTIALLGRPRIGGAQAGVRSVRLGGLICFAGLWLTWLLLVIP